MHGGSGWRCVVRAVEQQVEGKQKGVLARQTKKGKFDYLFKESSAPLTCLSTRFGYLRSRKGYREIEQEKEREY